MYFLFIKYSNLLNTNLIVTKERVTHDELNELITVRKLMFSDLVAYK